MKERKEQQTNGGLRYAIRSAFIPVAAHLLFSRDIRSYTEASASGGGQTLQRHQARHRKGEVLARSRRTTFRSSVAAPVDGKPLPPQGKTFARIEC